MRYLYVIRQLPLCVSCHLETTSSKSQSVGNQLPSNIGIITLNNGYLTQNYSSVYFDLYTLFVANEKTIHPGPNETQPSPNGITGSQSLIWNSWGHMCFWIWMFLIYKGNMVIYCKLPFLILLPTGVTFSFWHFHIAIKSSINKCIRNLDTNRDRKQLNIFERKVCRRILGPVYDNEKRNWRILTSKETYASVKKPTIIETIRLNRLHWFGHV